MDTTATVSAVETVGRDTYALRFDAPDGFAAEPGQFVKLGTEIDGESVARFYTPRRRPSTTPSRSRSASTPTRVASSPRSSRMPRRARR